MAASPSYSPYGLPLKSLPPGKLSSLILPDDVSQALDSAIKSAPSVETAVIRLMHNSDFDLAILKEVISNRGLNVSFSRVKFRFIALLVGLDPDARLRDAVYFDVHRARIPNALFTSIMEDILICIRNYGLPRDHQNEEARSRMIAPIFTRLVAEFNLLIINTPESIIEGRLTTKGRIEYLFRAFGGLTILFIEVKYHLNTGDEYYDAVAQVIAEADGCDYTNFHNGLQVPIHGILCNGDSFQFFRFNRDETPHVSMGHFPFSKSTLGHSQVLKLADLKFSSHQDFWQSTRAVAEAIFYVLLLGYQQSLNAYYDRSVARGQLEGKGRKSTPTWLVSLGHARETVENAVEAGRKHAAGEIEEAEELAKVAMLSLNKSVATAPGTFRRGDTELMRDIDSRTIALF